MVIMEAPLLLGAPIRNILWRASAALRGGTDREAEPK